MLLRTCKLCLAAGLAAALAACGGDTYVRVSGTTSISKGQELTDLQKAYDQGAITQEEYKKLREVMMKRNQ